MRINSKVFCGVAAVALLQLAGSSAFATLIGTSGNLTALYQTGGNYSWGSGGEFTVAGTALDLSNYAATTKGIGGAGSFQTFCIEGDEYTFSGAGSYYVNTMAVQGGINTNNNDPVSKGTAWLYAQYAQGILAGFVYGNVAGHQTSARDLQQAIWYLEDETGLGVNNAYVTLAINNTGGTLAAAKSDNATGGYGVYALNIFTGTINNPSVKQDQLYYNPNGERVPDGGLSVMLLGMALSGLALLRRHKSA